MFLKRRTNKVEVALNKSADRRKQKKSQKKTYPLDCAREVSQFRGYERKKRENRQMPYVRQSFERQNR